MIGLINLLKPPGPTSHDMVNWLRRLLGIRQIGHLGTLDPGAAGVLPICVGPATRLAEYMADWLKKYRVEVLLGIETDSQDFFGKIINNNLNCQLTEDQITKVLEQLIGQQEQIPPMFSAVKQGGKRLYKLAREGKQVVRKPRSVIIHDIQIQRIQLTKYCPRVLFDVTVSKGTYIRTLCADLGNKLGCGGCMAFLIRTACGPFTIKEALTTMEIESFFKQGDISFLIPPQVGLADWPQWTICPEAKTSLINGAFLYQDDFLDPGILEKCLGTLGCVQSPEGKLLAVGRIKEDSSGKRYCHPEKVLVGRSI